MYIGNYLSSLFALKNGDFPNSLVLSELALKSKNNDLELLENYYNSSIILGKINKSLEIISEIELLSDTVDNRFLYPTISEQVRRNDLISAYEVSNKLGLEKHNIFIKNMISIWKYVASGQKGNALSLLDNFINENDFRSEVFLYLKMQGLLISAYFDDIYEIETRYDELKKNVRDIPTRHYIDFVNVIYAKISQEEGKDFLFKNLPKALDLDFSIKEIKKNKIFDIKYLLSKVFFETGYIVARTEGFQSSVPFFWYSLHIDKNNTQAKIILASFFSSINQIDTAITILNESSDESSSWIAVEFEKSYLYEKKGDIKLAISTIENFSNNKFHSNRALLRISNIYRRNKDYRKSLETLKKIDLFKTDLPEAYYYISLNLVLLKEWEDAIESFDILLEKYPNNPEISNFVGYVLVDRNIRLGEGINLIKFAVNQEPKNGFFIDSLGWAYYKLGEISKAIVYLERAIELEPQEIEINDHLGEAYFKAGRIEEAKLVWKRAITLKGNDEIRKNIESKLRINF